MSKNRQNSIFSTKQSRKLIGFVVFVLLFELFLLAPPEVLAAESGNTSPESAITTENNEKDPGLISPKAAFENTLPENEDLKVAWSTYRTMTAYNSDPAQCDSTPCITANGFNVCEHGIEDTIAANWLKFGTKVRIPEMFGDKIFVVRDRMNPRFDDRVDIWMLEKETARSFGKRILKIEILETP